VKQQACGGMIVGSSVEKGGQDEELPLSTRDPAFLGLVLQATRGLLRLC